MTGTNQALGTIDYMAPEQISETRSVDIRADIYSMGCTLYKLLVGHAPFSVSPHVPDYEIMRGHVEQTPPPLGKFRPDVPAEVAAVVNRMLAKDPARRVSDPGRGGRSPGAVRRNRRPGGALGPRRTNAAAGQRRQPG